MYSSFVVLDVKLEHAYALDALPSLYSFHFRIVVRPEVLKLIWMVTECDQGEGVYANDEGVGVEADSWNLVR